MSRPLPLFFPLIALTTCTYSQFAPSSYGLSHFSPLCPCCSALHPPSTRAGVALKQHRIYKHKDFEKNHSSHLFFSQKSCRMDLPPKPAHAAITSAWHILSSNSDSPCKNLQIPEVETLPCKTARVFICLLYIWSQFIVSGGIHPKSNKWLSHSCLPRKLVWRHATSKEWRDFLKQFFFVTSLFRFPCKGIITLSKLLTCFGPQQKGCKGSVALSSLFILNILLGYFNTWMCFYQSLFQTEMKICQFSCVINRQIRSK